MWGMCSRKKKKRGKKRWRGAKGSDYTHLDLQDRKDLCLRVRTMVTALGKVLLPSVLVLYL